MRVKVLGAAVVMVFAIAVAPTVVIAQSNDTSVDTTTTVDEASDATDQTTDRASDRQARIEDYKRQATDRLTAAQERRIANACSAAQAKVAAVQTNTSGAIERRRTAYANISEKLAEIVRKLQAGSVDTTELEASIQEMERLAAAVVTAAEAYQATIADLAEMDCAADPEGFQAALSVARQQRATVVAQAQALRDYISGTLKPLLQSIREQLTSDATDGAEEA